MRIRELGGVADSSAEFGATPTSSALNHEAASVLMKILYAARMARFDLLKATNALACKLTKWDEKCDLQLRRLVAYIWSSLGKRLVGYVSKDDKTGWPTPVHGRRSGRMPGHPALYHWCVPLYSGLRHHVPSCGHP